MSGRGVGARRLEPAAIAGVMSREVANFRTFWKATTFSSVLEPTIYLLAFGLGLGATLVSQVDGLDYVEFVGTGMVATAVIFSSALPAMFGTFVKHRFQNTYDAILAAPVDVEELVTAEMLWIGLRAGVYGCFPLIVSFAFGLDPTWGMLLVPLFCFITALGFAAFGIAVAGTVAKIDSFNYVTTLVITPLFLVAGTFFPIDQLPEGVQVIANLNPLYQLVELVRGAAFGFHGRRPAQGRGPGPVRAGDVASRGAPDEPPPDRLMAGRLALIAGSSLSDSELPVGDWELLQRHGPPGAYVLPHLIDHVSNLRSLADAGCDRVLAVASVGGLREELGPGSMLCPDDFIALDAAPSSAHDDSSAHRVPGFDGDWRSRVLRGDRRCRRRGGRRRRLLAVRRARGSRPGRRSGSSPSTRT